MSQSPLTIPRIYHTFWVGSRPAPMEWINSWKEKNPEWEHKLWGNEEIFGRTWRNQELVDFYREREIWAGVADVVRLEILLENGGFAAGADSICLEPVDELFTDPAFDAYTSYENEVVTGELMSPLLACTQGNKLARALIMMLTVKWENNRDKVGLVPWKTTGNLFMMHAVKALEYPRLKIFPSHYLLPEHHSGVKYQGTDKVYAHHMWGTGKNAYETLDKKHG